MVIFNSKLIINIEDKPSFKEDSLHMNAKAFDIWQKALEPYLDESKKD